MLHFWQPWTFFVIFFNNNLRFFIIIYLFQGSWCEIKWTLLSISSVSLKFEIFQNFLPENYLLYNDFKCACHIFTWNDIPWPCRIQITPSVSWFIPFQSLYKVQCDHEKKNVMISHLYVQPDSFTTPYRTLQLQCL